MNLDPTTTIHIKKQIVITEFSDSKTVVIITTPQKPNTLAHGQQCVSLRSAITYLNKEVK